MPAAMGGGRPLRIIAGSAAGRRLDVPDVPGLRPTSGRVREAIFSMLMGELAEANVVDLCAGCGSLGLEALSRGARHCTFVDDSGPALGALRANLGQVGWAARGGVVRADVREVADVLRGRCYDIALLDPPYRSGLVPVALAGLASGRLVVDGADVLAVHERALEPQPPSGWEVLTRRSYGDSGLTRFVVHAGPQEHDA